MTDRSDRRGLAAGYRLEQYEIRDLQAADRVGLRYAAFDHASGEPVGLREYLPAGVAARREGADVQVETSAAFDPGLAGFVTDALRLARIDHPNVARARGHVRANGTAYLVTDPLPETTLARRLDLDRTLSPAALPPILHGLLDGLEAVHRAGLLHGQLSPEAIALDEGKPLLIDFGVARQAGGTARRAFRPASKFHTDPPNGDFAALEQYADRGQEGPWTDLYALAAVMFRCATGRVPPNALQRALQEEALSLRDTGATGYDSAVLAGIEAALAIRVADRPRNVAAWRELHTPPGDEPPATRPPTRVPGTARTAARGFRRPEAATTPATPSAPVVAGRRAARAREEASTEGGAARWGLPAVVLVALISVLTWVDAGVLRAPAPAPEAGQRDPSGRAEPAGQPRPTPPAPRDVTPERPRERAPAPAPDTGRAPAPGSSPTETVVPPRADPETTAESAGQATDTAPQVETAPLTSGTEAAPPSQPVPTAPPSTTAEAPSSADPETDDAAVPRTGGSPPDVRAPEPGPVPVPVPAHTLTLELVPADARVSFADDVPPYRPGMELPPGAYRILVTRTGFLPELRTVRVSGATRTRIVLEPDSRGTR